MKIPKPKTLISILSISLVFALVGGIAGHRWADKHVRYITGGQPGPMNCLPCHAYLHKNSPLARLMEKKYLSPIDIAVSPDANRLYVTAEDADALLVVSTMEEKLLAKIAVGKRPNSVVVNREGSTAYVSNRWSNTISIVGIAEQRVTATLAVGAGPAGFVLGPEDRTLYVANSYSDDISVVDLTKGAEIKRLPAGRDPYAVALSPDGAFVYVTNRRSNSVDISRPPIAEVTVIDTRSQRVVERKPFQSAHQMEGIHFTPDGNLALATLVRPKNLLPLTQVSQGWMMTFGLGVMETGKNGRTTQILLDEVNAFFADPYDIVIATDGRRAFVTNAGANCVTAIEIEALRSLLDNATPDQRAIFANHLGISSRYVIKRIPTGSNPKGLALSPDGKRLYVAERLEDRITVINTETLEVIKNIELGKPQNVSYVRRGQRLFNNANAGAFQGQFSCRTCHPDGDQDALTYDIAPDGLGLNLVNTISLRDIGATAPYKWNGKNVSLYMQCGIRFAKFLTRAEPFSPEDLNALVAYILSLTHPPNQYQKADGELTPAQRRGKAIYERDLTNDGRVIPDKDRCITCHPPPYFTNRQTSDVGTLVKYDTPKEFDVPHLRNVYSTAPYLHDGSAATLEEIWTKHNPDDKHGIANDLTKTQLNDLVEYLRVLGSEEGDN